MPPELVVNALKSPLSCLLMLARPSGEFHTNPEGIASIKKHDKRTKRL